MNNNPLFPKCTTENRPLKKKHPSTTCWSMSLLDLCTNSALPFPWQAPLLALRRALALVEPVAPASTVCRHQPASGLGTTAPQSFTSAATTCEHFFHSPALTIPSPLSLSLTLLSTAYWHCWQKFHVFSNLI